MTALTKTQWLVLNAAADDCEDLEQIYRSMSLEFSAEKHDPSDPNAFYWREAADAVPLSEIVDAIRVLVDRGFLSVRLSQGDISAQLWNDLSYLWQGWFGITGMGRTALVSESDAGKREDLREDLNRAIKGDEKGVRRGGHH